MNDFFLALVGLAILETRLSFPDSIDDDAVPFPFFLAFLLLLLRSEHLYVSYNTYLAYVCHSLGLCLPQFGFVIMMLHFATTFTITMT